jgi:hypothetical protein
MEQQILQMETALWHDYGDQDWNMILRAGPDCICIFFASVSKALGIDLRGIGLE